MFAMSEEKFDAIVVGAGFAGISAAITMAKAGMNVVVLEKGEKPGSKNVIGGILYRHYLEEVVGDDWKEAPLERPIVEEQRWLMTPNAAIRVLGYKNLRNKDHNAHSWSVLRGKFDPWYASKAEEAGAYVIPETVAEELLVRDGSVVGVRTGREGDLFGNLVIIATGIGLGANLLERAHLKKPTKPNQVALAVKEIMQLDPHLIEERFNCDPGEGASVECYGYATEGMAGFMFIYTNQDSLSVGGGALLSDFVRTNRSPNELLEHFKTMTAIKPLLQGAETVEYSAKQIPEGRIRDMPKLYGNGYLVCGDAAMMSNPVHREGGSLAMASGRMAGETAIRAMNTGDFGEKTLRDYQVRLNGSWVMADLLQYDKAVPLLEHNRRYLVKYPELLDRALDEFFRVDGVSKWTKERRILRMFRKEGGVRFLWDNVKALWTMEGGRRRFTDSR